MGRVCYCVGMTNTDYGHILEALLRMIGKADTEFQQQIANGIGVEHEELMNFIDNAEFPVIGTKDRHSLNVR